MTENGRNRREEASTYLQYLPATYQGDPFLGRFLNVFEDVLSPIQAMVSALPELFDPRLAPPAMLERLASWVGAQRPAGSSEARWRHLVRQTLWLHRWRGTKRGLRAALEAATGRRPLITEYAAGLVLGPDATLSLNGTLEGGRPLHFDVTFDCSPGEVDKALIDDILRWCKPAHVSYSLTLRPL
jgi:phage tail-like protein